MGKVRFSIGVPVYNAEKYLRECIDSILNQSFTDFELLLVNDGSKDSSGAICDEYAKKDSRIKVFHNENQGSYATRVFAASNATGEFCTFFDSDDYIDAGYLERADEMLEKENCDLLVFRYGPVIDGVRKEMKPYWDDIKIFEGEEKKEFYYAMITGFCFNALYIKFIRTELLKQDPLELKDYSFVKNYDDFLQSLYPVFNAKRIVYVPECYYNYRMNEESLTHKIDPKIYDSIFAVRSVAWENYIKGTDILGQNENRVYAADSARSAMKIVKLIAQHNSLTDDEKIGIFKNISEHEFYTEFIEPNLVKTDLENKWQFIYELFSRHSYKLLLSTVRMITRIKK